MPRESAVDVWSKAIYWLRVTVAGALIAPLIGLAACSTEHATAPADLPPWAAGFFISGPQSGAARSLGVSATSSSHVAFVSARPGTFVSGKTVIVRNLDRQTDAIEIMVFDGGFDPVAIEAENGDRLELKVIYASSNAASFVVKVPPRRPPSVVRTSPSHGRTDVALNTMIVEVIFNEPIDARTLTPESVQLTLDGRRVDGSIVLDANGWSLSYLLKAPLQASSTFKLTLSGNILSAEGEPMGSSYEAEFSTTAIQPGSSLALCEVIYDVLPEPAPLTGCFVPQSGEPPLSTLLISQAGTQLLGVARYNGEGLMFSWMHAYQPIGNISARQSGEALDSVVIDIPEDEDGQKHFLFQGVIPDVTGERINGQWKEVDASNQSSPWSPLVLNRISTIAPTSESGDVVVVVGLMAGCTGNAAYLCNPRLPETLLLDDLVPKSFSEPGRVIFNSVPDGLHTLQVMGGHYGGPVICGFWFSTGQKITFVVKDGRSYIIDLTYECF